jgi:predicted flap endonuclease-1-like 5' DNA nuclease
MWKVFCLGLLVGWLVEWLIDWMFWRRNRYVVAADAPAPTAQAARAAVIAPVAGPAAAAAPASPAAAGWTPYRDDEIEAIEGIGPKIAELLRARGIGDFRKIADTPVAELAAILEAAGPRFRLANPTTWPEQAALAARRDWTGFEKLKQALTAGVRKPGDGQ